MKRFIPDEVWIESSELDTPLAREVRSRLADRPIRVLDGDGFAAPSDVIAGKRRLALRRHRGSFVRHCPAGTPGLVCCNYLVVNLASNCPYDCSYCFLQEYLADNPVLTAFTNVDEALTEIDTILRAHPDRTFRIGTGEIADSLALDPLTGLSQWLVPFFAARPNAILELKTKSDCVDQLLSLDPCGRVVVSWSVNAAAIVDEEEHGTATLAERLAAAQRVERAGYRLGFHFDPLIEFDGWERAYREVVDMIFASVTSAHIAWFSLGSLRLTPPLMEAIRGRGSAQRVLGGELVRTDDGKARVWRGLRLKMYRSVIAQIRAIAPDVPLYLCMEPPSVWSRVMGTVPSDRQLGMRLAAGAAW